MNVETLLWEKKWSVVYLSVFLPGELVLCAGNDRVGIDQQTGVYAGASPPRSPPPGQEEGDGEGQGSLHDRGAVELDW